MIMLLNKVVKLKLLKVLNRSTHFWVWTRFPMYFSIHFSIILSLAHAHTPYVNIIVMNNKMFNRTALYSLEMANWQWKACFKHSDYRYAYSKNGELRHRTCQIMNSTSCKYIKFIRTDFSNNLFRCDFYIDVHISVSVCVCVWVCLPIENAHFT